MTGLRIAVTGATGNLGTSVVRALCDDEAVDAVLGIARRRPAWTYPKLDHATADIATDPLTHLFDGCDVVVHLAWLLQPTHQPETTWRVNALGSKRVFEAVTDAGVPSVVYGSSVAAYSPRADLEPVAESWPTDGSPAAAYSREKAYVERLLDVVERDHPKLRVVRMRPGFVFRRESAASQRRLFLGPFMPVWLAKPGRVPVLPVLPDLRLQVVHSTDVARAYRTAALSGVAGAFNLAAEPVLDVAMLADLLKARGVPVPFAPVRAALGAAWRLHAVPAPPGLFDVLRRLPVMDTSRARAELGWRPRYSATETMLEFLTGLRESTGFDTPPLRGRPGEVRAAAGWP